MTNMIIDFNKCSTEIGKKLFAGKENGKQGKIYFGLNIIREDVIFDIKMESGIVVSSSYYFGLLKEHVIIFNNGNEFLENVYLNGEKYQKSVLPELDRAVRRVFRDY